MEDAMFMRSIRNVALASVAALAFAMANPAAANAGSRGGDRAALAFFTVMAGTIAAIAIAEAARRDRVEYVYLDKPRRHWNRYDDRRHWRRR
jgi:hypothetical protein